MRLLNTASIRLHAFLDDIPPYVTLSHRWQNGVGVNEPSLQDLQAYYHSRVEDGDKSLGQGRDSSGIFPLPLTTPGLQKVLDFCRISRERGYEWAWVDTVCIDKTSSAELSEAINSMFKWYQESECCFVFLHDVSSVRWKDELENSDWFWRGWTLQELIAPYDALLFSADWTELGSKVSLSSAISSITRIPVDVISDPEAIDAYNIAQRFSWAATRKTTQSEDQSYCLLGLVGVKMTLQYGEGGETAFERLQKELMDHFDDESILSWDVYADDHKSASENVTINFENSASQVTGSITGLFARSIQSFAHGAKIRSARERAPSAPNRWTNRGLEVQRTIEILSGVSDLLIEDTVVKDQAVRLMPLACRQETSNEPCYILLVADSLAENPNLNRWRRVNVAQPQRDDLNAVITKKRGQPEEKHLFICIQWPEYRRRARLLVNSHDQNGQETPSKQIYKAQRMRRDRRAPERYDRDSRAIPNRVRDYTGK